MNKINIINKRHKNQRFFKKRAKKFFLPAKIFLPADQKRVTLDPINRYEKRENRSRVTKNKYQVKIIFN